jgi:hypothetical protein
VLHANTGGLDSVRFRVPLVVPMNDTTGIWFLMVEKSGGEGPHSRVLVVPRSQDHSDTIRQAPHVGDEAFSVAQIYFVRTPGTLVVYDSDPGNTVNRHAPCFSKRRRSLRSSDEQMQTADSNRIGNGDVDAPSERDVSIGFGSLGQSYSIRTGFYLRTVLSSPLRRDQRASHFASTHKLFDRDSKDRPRSTTGSDPPTVEGSGND